MATKKYNYSFEEGNRPIKMTPNNQISRVRIDIKGM